MAPSAEEDKKDVAVVFVELGALAEMLGVLKCERVKAEDLPQLGELVGAGGVEVEPKELIAPQVIPDARLVDAGEARHHESKLFACGLRRRCFGLPTGIVVSLSAAVGHIVPGTEARRASRFARIEAHSRPTPRMLCVRPVGNRVHRDRASAGDAGPLYRRRISCSRRRRRARRRPAGRSEDRAWRGQPHGNRRLSRTCPQTRRRPALARGRRRGCC